MPVNNLILFVSQRGFLQTENIQLNGSKLGIDGNYWLREILIKEPAVVAMGGTPLTLRETIEKELAHFKEHNIQPVFVFPGLSIKRRDKDETIANKDTLTKDRAVGWDLYDRGKTEEAMDTWKKNGGVPPASLHNLVCSILREHQVEFMRAPYWSWAQLAYMYKEKLLDAVYGSSELLMWDIDRLIISFDFNKKIYRWVDKATLLENPKATKDPNSKINVKISKDHFLDICILAGFDHCPSFPFSAHKVDPYVRVPHTGEISEIIDLVSQFYNGYTALQSIPFLDTHVRTEIAEFGRMRFAVKNHVVMTVEGKAKPLDDGDIPSDMHDIIGYRMPDEIYYYLTRGLIGPQCIDALLSGVLVEAPPLDNGETNEYQTFLHQLVVLRTQTLSLLTQPLNKFFQQLKITSHFWFDREAKPMKHHELQSEEHERYLNNTFDKIKWNAPVSFLEKEKKAQNTTSITVSFCMKAVEKESDASQTRSESTPEQPLVGTDEIVATVFWKSLEIRDFLTSKHCHSPWGIALAAALDAAAKVPTLANDPSVQEALLTAFELIRFEVLKSAPYSKTYSKMSGDDKKKGHITLLSRALSLLPMKLKAAPWKGPLNRDLVVFNSCVNALNHSYRNLYEMVTLSLFTNGLVEKERKDYFGIANRLPYISDGNVALGLVTRYYLEKSLGESAPRAMQLTEEAFESCVCLKADLQKGFQFWAALMAGIGMLKVKKRETFAEFTEVDRWLQSEQKLLE